MIEERRCGTVARDLVEVLPEEHCCLFTSEQGLRKEAGL
jgi:hypothetical protein